MVACDDIALFINAKASVCVAVVSKADIEVIVNDEFLQVLDMC